MARKLDRVRKKLGERKVTGVGRVSRRRSEYFRIWKLRRRYDRESGKFIINIGYETAVPEPTSRVVSVANVLTVVG